MSDERLRDGLATMKSVFGVDWNMQLQPDEPANAHDLNALLVEHAFTDSWQRDGLDRRTKSMMTMATMVATGQPDELRKHMHGALAIGITKDEIVEMLIHTLAYCGAPRASAAYTITRSVFAKYPSPTE